MTLLLVVLVVLVVLHGLDKGHGHALVAINVEVDGVDGVAAGDRAGDGSGLDVAGLDLSLTLQGCVTCQ